MHRGEARDSLPTSIRFFLKHYPRLMKECQKHSNYLVFPNTNYFSCIFINPNGKIRQSADCCAAREMIALVAILATGRSHFCQLATARFTLCLSVYFWLLRFYNLHQSRWSHVTLKDNPHKEACFQLYEPSNNKCSRCEFSQAKQLR